MKLSIPIVLIFLLSLFEPLKAGVDGYDSDKSQWSKLMIATYKGNHKKMEKQLRNDVDVNHYDQNGTTALRIAIIKQDILAVNIILEDEKLDKLWSDMIREACHYKNAEIVRALFESGFPVKPNEFNYTLLMVSSAFGTLETVKIILEIGSEFEDDINEQRTNDGFTALMLAVSNGKVETTRFLLKSGASKSIVNSQGHTVSYYINFIDNENIKKELKILIL